jgi:cytochrome oxidase assembly protein ShyY1
VYRFLLTPRWLGFAALAVVLSATMVGLGFWQLDRYHARHAFNVRVSQAAKAAPVPLATVAGVGRPVRDDQEWTRVRVTGTYDPAKTVVARDRTVNGSVGFEILTPMVLADDSVIMVDRGFLAAAGSLTPPPVPAAPTGPVTVVGRVHTPESSPDAPATVGGQTSVRRIDPARLAPVLGYPAVYADYLLLDSQTPAAAAGFTAIPADHQASWLNAGYTVQWWAFSLLTLVAFGWAARREANDRRLGIDRRTTDRAPRSRDRLGEDDPTFHVPSARRADTTLGG